MGQNNREQMGYRGAGTPKDLRDSNQTGAISQRINQETIGADTQTILISYDVHLTIEEHMHANEVQSFYWTSKNFKYKLCSASSSQSFVFSSCSCVNNFKHSCTIEAE